MFHPVNQAETDAFDVAMSQWEKSRKRPDLKEEDRVMGAVARAIHMMWVHYEFFNRIKPNE